MPEPASSTTVGITLGSVLFGAFTVGDLLLCAGGLTVVGGVITFINFRMRQGQQEGQVSVRKQQHQIDKVAQDLKFCVDQSAQINQSAKEFIKEATERLHSSTAATQHLGKGDK